MLTSKPCDICGAVFEAKSIRNRYCSERCKMTANNHVTYKKMVEQGRCPSCRQPKPADGYVLCDECRAGNRERHIARRPEPKPFPCTVCGKPFCRNATNAKYCSDECRKANPTGICPRCKERPSAEGYKMCVECREARSHWWQGRSEESLEIALRNQRAWRERNPGYYTPVNLKSNFKAKIAVFEHYGLACACCGEDNFWFLTIDHINGGGNAHRRELFGKHGANGSVRFYRWLIRNDFPGGFQTLCYNCNMGRAKCGGICPHELSRND